MRDGRDEHPGAGVNVTTAAPGRTHWNVEHREAGVRVTVAARTEDETRALAWRRWYGRDPTNEFDERLRAEFLVRDCGIPVE